MSTDERERAELSDSELMRLFWALKPDERQQRALTYTQWKDSIDIQVPTLFLRQLADAIYARALAATPTPAQAPAQPVARELLEIMIASSVVLTDKEGTVTGYQVKTGALHKLIGLFGATVPAGLPEVVQDTFTEDDELRGQSGAVLRAMVRFWQKQCEVLRAVPPQAAAQAPAQPPPHWMDVKALEVARRFTQDTEGQRRASLQCAVVEAMQFAAAPPAVTAKPIAWTQDNANQWSESDYGFYITLDSDEDRDADNPYFAAWGEGDEDRFDSLEAAQRWCQDKINSYFREYAVIAAPAQAAQPQWSGRVIEVDYETHRAVVRYEGPHPCIGVEVAAQAAHSAPVAWSEHVEQRLLTWKQRTMNRSGDNLALDDFMDKESLADLIDFVCDEYAHPATQTPRPNEPELGAQGKEER